MKVAKFEGCNISKRQVIPSNGCNIRTPIMRAVRRVILTEGNWAIECRGKTNSV